MDWFRIIVLTVAIIVLIILLILIGLLLNKGNTNQAWPPSYNTCPNYWMISEDGSNCMIPANLGANSLNTGKIYGNLPANLPSEGSALTTRFVKYNNPMAYVADPTGGDYIALDKFKGVCEKKCWSNKFDIVWDGVSNYNNCSSASC